LRDSPRVGLITC